MPTRWREAWNDALYGPNGFFLHSRPTDHFRTSVTSSDVFAEAIARLARDAGLDAVVDLGAGGGELLARLHGIDPALRLTGVDLAPRPDLPAGIAWTDELPAEIDGLLIAHEWLDNIPCDVVELDDDGVVRLVEVDPDTGAERLGDPVESDWLDALVAAHRARRAGRDRRTPRRRLGRRGRAACTASRSPSTTAHLADGRPPYGSLASFAHGQEVDVVPDGTRDVTAHVAVDAVADAAGASLERQRDALARLGVDGTRPPLELATRRPTGLRRRAGPRVRVGRAAGPRRLGRLLVARHRHPRARLTAHEPAARGHRGRRERVRHHRHGAQHRPPAPRHPRRPAPAAHARRRTHRALRADHRLHAPRRREALRGARLPPDHRAGEPARLAQRVQLRARRRAGRRGHARHGGARAGDLDPHAARRAQPGAQPPDVPRAPTRSSSAPSRRSSTPSASGRRCRR